MADQEQANQHLIQLVLSLHAGAMQAMGKIASPITGKIERDLTMAQASIDMLAMLETKTVGNLTNDEKQMLTHTLYELRMNFVEESKKKDVDSESTDKSEDTSKDVSNKDTGQNEGKSD